MLEGAVKYEALDTQIRALDLYSRILIGQYRELYYYSRLSGKNTDELYFNHYAKMLRDTLIPGLSDSDLRCSYGIWADETDPLATKAFDIQQVLRYQVSYNKWPNGGITVNFHEPFIHGKWNMTDEQIEDCKKYLVAKRGFRENIVAPVVITSFEDDNEVATVKVYDEQVMQIIQDAMEVYDLVGQGEIEKVFIKLYPDMPEFAAAVLSSLYNVFNGLVS